jgi:hypothetical protein
MAFLSYQAESYVIPVQTGTSVQAWLDANLSVEEQLDEFP